MATAIALRGKGPSLLCFRTPTYSASSSTSSSSTSASGVKKGDTENDPKVATSSNSSLSLLPVTLVSKKPAVLIGKAKRQQPQLSEHEMKTQPSVEETKLAHEEHEQNEKGYEPQTLPAESHHGPRTDCWVEIEPVQPYVAGTRSPSPSPTSSGRRQIQLGSSRILSWLEIVGVAVVRLRKLTGRDYFHHRTDICSYIDKNWDDICRGHERTPTWWKTVLASMTTNREIFVTANPGTGVWTLRPEQRKPFEVIEDSWTKGLDLPETFVEIPAKHKSSPSPKASSQKKRGRGKEADTSLTESSLRSSSCKKQRIDNDKQSRRHSYSGEGTNPRFITDHCCHGCKLKRGIVVLCTKCMAKFCEPCLDKYEEVFNEVLRKKTWECPRCRDICRCAICRRHREQETSRPQRRASLDSFPTSSKEPGQEDHEEFDSRIIASSINSNGEREYCVRWYDKDTGEFSTSWETKESIATRSNEKLLADFETRSLKIHIKNIRGLDLSSRNASPEPSSVASPSSSANRRKRSSDYDIDRLVCLGLPPCRSITPIPKPENIWTPTYREVPENDGGDEDDDDDDDDDEEEDLSDEVFTARHEKAAEELRKLMFGAASQKQSSPVPSSSTSTTSSLPHSESKSK